MKGYDELWRQARQDVYLKAFAKPQGKYRGIMVAVEPTGSAKTYFVQDLKDLNASRKGLDVERRGS